MFEGYVICGTPRTGSTLHCNLLASTKAAGNPDSFYGRKFMPAWAEEWRLPGRDSMSERDFNIAYLNAAVAAGKGGTGVFGLRLMRENLVNFPQSSIRFSRSFLRTEPASKKPLAGFCTFTYPAKTSLPRRYP